MTIKISFWQLLCLLFVTLKLSSHINIPWWQALAPLAVHLLIKLEEQYRLMRHGKKMPITWWLT